MIYNLELTDTFGGQANYSWVIRKQLEVTEGTSDLALVRRAKAALGLTGVPCRKTDLGEGWELRSTASCVVAFITPEY